jgi:hypothetical protein
MPALPLTERNLIPRGKIKSNSEKRDEKNPRIRATFSNSMRIFAVLRTAFASAMQSFSKPSFLIPDSKPKPCQRAEICRTILEGIRQNLSNPAQTVLVFERLELQKAWYQRGATEFGKRQTEEKRLTKHCLPDTDEKRATNRND